MQTCAAPSDDTYAAAAAGLTQSDRHAYFEQRLYVLSPFGWAGTTFILLLLMLASYVGAAVSSGSRPLAFLSGGGFPASERDALALAALLTTVLAAQRYGRVRERGELRALAKVLKGGVNEAVEMVKATPPESGLVFATLLGLSIALPIAYFFILQHPARLIAVPAERWWFAITNILVIVLFARGVALTRAAGRSAKRIIEERLNIDLLRIEDMAVWGRSAARNASIWFVICAVVFLLLINEPFSLFIAVLLLACAAMGAYVFFGTMERVREQIHQTKAAELERVRSQIETVRGESGRSADAAQRLQGLIAYEKRIHEVHEWPFDQSTLVRFGASGLVLGVPWFGQAVAQYLVDHMVK